MTDIDSIVLRVIDLPEVEGCDVYVDMDDDVHIVATIAAGASLTAQTIRSHLAGDIPSGIRLSVSTRWAT